MLRGPSYMCELLISMTEELSDVCRNWPTETQAQRFPGNAIRRVSACTRVPHEEGNSTGGLSLGSQTDGGVAQDKVFVRAVHSTL